MLGNAGNHVLPEIKTENFKLPSSFCLLRSNPSNGQLSSFPCSFPTKKPCQILPAWLGVGDPNFLPLLGLRQTHRGRRNRRVLRPPPREAPRSPRPQRRGREASRGASGTVQFPADPERGVRGDAGGPKASLALDRRRGCHGHGKGEFSAMIVLELRF